MVEAGREMVMWKREDGRGWKRDGDVEERGW